MKERKKTTGNGVDREEIQRLAYRLWEERGKKPGSPDDDWFRAEDVPPQTEMEEAFRR
jgi:hypothetical protein